MTFENLEMYRLAIGLNDQKAKVQLLDTEYCYNTVSEYVANHFGGATVTMAKGVYKHEDGITVVRENSIIVDLVYVSEDDINKMVSHFKTVFNQESIMVIKWPKVDVSFA